MDRDRDPFPPAVGGCSLLTIFAVLALTVFALLSLSTAQTDRRLSEASARAVGAYYAADFRAQEILSRLRLGELPEGVLLEDGVYSWTVPISDAQELRAEVSFPAGPGGAYQILRWEAAPTEAWAPSDELQLWDGTF